MNRKGFSLPTLITTSVVRGSQHGESHGGIYLLNFAQESVDQVVDWNTSEIDFSGRGWDRGLRGIAFFAGEIYIAASDELFVYDQEFKIHRSFRSEVPVTRKNMLIVKMMIDSNHDKVEKHIHRPDRST